MPSQAGQFPRKPWFLATKTEFQFVAYFLCEESARVFLGWASRCSQRACGDPQGRRGPPPREQGTPRATGTCLAQPVLGPVDQGTCAHSQCTWKPPLPGMPSCRDGRWRGAPAAWMVPPATTLSWGHPSSGGLRGVRKDPSFMYDHCVLQAGAGGASARELTENLISQPHCSLQITGNKGICRVTAAEGCLH